MDAHNALGLSELWAQADFIIQSVAALLVLMSVASWYLILSKGLSLLLARRHVGAVEQFWNAPSLDDVSELAEPVLKHRMALSFRARADGMTVSEVIAGLKAKIG